MNTTLPTPLVSCVGALIWSLATAFPLPSPAAALAAEVVDGEGTLHIPPFVLPESSYLSAETRAELKRYREREVDFAAKDCPAWEGADRAQMAAMRQCEADAFYKTPTYHRMSDRYAVTITARTIRGVYTEIFAPAEGISRKNKSRVLINLHGGGFLGGSRTLSRLESMPVASVGKIKVISIDYRQAPEHSFPSASEDVAAVYAELLKNYKPINIGIYGCSAGGLLTAQSIAWMQKHGLPLPGAIGMFCEGASNWTEGDSGRFLAVLSPEAARPNPYFRNTDANDPLVFPARSAQVMAKFPPSLLISGTRDFALSPVVYTHSVLVSQGVPAELHVWEGLGHAFFFDPELPQSRQVYAVVAKFFDSHLGRSVLVQLSARPRVSGMASQTRTNAAAATAAKKQQALGSSG